VSNKVAGDNVTPASGSANLVSGNAGAQTITSIGTLALAGMSAGNYTLVGASGSVTVNPLAVNLTGSRTYDGTATAVFGILSMSNKVGSDNVLVASGNATLAGKNVGAVTITSIGTLHLGGTSASNYTLTGATGSVTITLAPLKITAASKSMIYGGTLPALTLTYAGLVAGDTATTFASPPDTAPKLSTVSARSQVGQYAITVGGVPLICPTSLCTRHACFRLTLRAECLASGT
jgi:MBG domain (YGX type)/YDG domain